MTTNGDDQSPKRLPPNALLSATAGSSATNAVVILSDRQLSDGDLSYTIDLSGGAFTPADGPATLVIAPSRFHATRFPSQLAWTGRQEDSYQRKGHSHVRR